MAEAYQIERVISHVYRRTYGATMPQLRINLSLSVATEYLSLSFPTPLLQHGPCIKYMYVMYMIDASLL